MNDSREPFMPSVKILDVAYTEHAINTDKKFDVWDTVLSKEVWNKKYKDPSDASIWQTCSRVAHALFPEDQDKSHRVTELMHEGILVPAGRIISGAGTGNRVTLMNCYVMGTMEDSLDSIFKTLSQTALTMQMGGGTGTDFSTLRPHKALLKRTGSSSSGPLPFMDTWDAMCKTIMSAGHRRGAMMATMDISHPDILEFIRAKQEKSRLRNFNVSVLVSDSFMEVLKNGDDWNFVHPTRHADWSDIECTSRIVGQDKGKTLYRWGTMPAKDLWEILTKNTYEYSEPGVIFIDRINNTNNLKNVEVIRCTNPCGEQPLPPYGACDLGHVNLARLVLAPYTEHAIIDWGQLAEAVYLMVELLDNVIDVTQYPLQAQEEEMKRKRRIGLGVTGLADALAMLGFRYGTDEAVKITEEIGRFIAGKAYMKSLNLAKSKGPAPAFNDKTFNYTFAWTLGEPGLVAQIQKHGLRNCVLLTVAPTGTTSAFYGNVSSGCEPNFDHRTIRNMRQPDDTYKSFTEYSYSVRYYAHIKGCSLEAAYLHCLTTYQDTFPTVKDLSIEDHVKMQAAVQKYTDASVSKTVNVPEETTYEDFKGVYQLAWDLGCKGCTTYRPSEVRGSILESAKPVEEGTMGQLFSTPDETTSPELPADQRPAPRTSAAAQAVEQASKQRPKALEGRTYKIKWPNLAAAIYLTINHDDVGEIQEVFISSKNSQYAEWATALSVILSKLLKLSKDPVMVANELMQINLSMNPSWDGGRFFGSIIAQIGAHLKEHAEEFDDMQEMRNYVPHEQFVVATIVSRATAFGIAKAQLDVGDPVTLGNAHQCTACGGFNVKMKEGCMTCDDCGQSTCN